MGILTRKQKLDNDRTRTNLETKEEEPNPEYVDLDKLANITMGFVGADLANLCSKSAVSAITRAARDIDLEADYLPVEFYENLKMGMSDFMSALPDVPPSALKEFVVAKPSVTFDDIGGLEDVKRELMEMIEFGKDNDGYFDAMGIKPPSGCMFYGPTGCGKTLMAKAMANEMESNLSPSRALSFLRSGSVSRRKICVRFSRKEGRPARVSCFLMRWTRSPRSGGMARMQVSETAWSISS